MRPITLLVPDAGPLISLALGEALDLLLRLGVPVWVVDAVLAETTADAGRPGAAAIDRFVRQGGDRVRVAQTTVGEMAQARRAREPGSRPRGLGEAAVAEFLARLDELVESGWPVLVLFEDSDVRRIEAAGRSPSRALIDRPSPEAYGGSSWLPLADLEEGVSNG